MSVIVSRVQLEIPQKGTSLWLYRNCGMWQIGGHRSFLRGAGHMHAKGGQEGEAMRPDYRQSHRSKWDSNGKDRVGSFRNRGLKAIHQVC